MVAAVLVSVIKNMAVSVWWKMTSELAILLEPEVSHFQWLTSSSYVQSVGAFLGWRGTLSE